MKTRTVNVNLPVAPYSIHITNGWEQVPLFLEKSIEGKKLLVISDENVYQLYFHKVQPLLTNSPFKIHWAIIPPGENSKNLAMAETLYTKALEAGLDRSSSIIALGGGVVGDLAGFIAATYMRGINLIQIPTTLLAQIDSSVGGKVAVNHPLAKNIIGSFYQPKGVYINTQTLYDLPPREFSTGMAELIKYGFIWDESLLPWLEDNIKLLMKRNEDILTYAIYESCRIKADIVEQDEKENGLRAILNFGHTVGHAIESVTGYSRYTHGEAVALGMLCEVLLAHRMGLVRVSLVDRLMALLKQANLPIKIPSIDIDNLIGVMAHDKKNMGGDIVFVLPTGIGKVDIFTKLDNKLLRQVLKQLN